MSRWILEEPLDPEALLHETEDPACGGVVVFCGTVRNENEGLPVSGMTYEAHAPMAEKALRAIEAEVCARFAARHCRIQHRVGPLKLGEVSVVVVVRAPHRAAAFEGARYAIDEVKKRAPIWKEEHYVNGASRYLEGVPLQSGEDA
ncbi:MAG: molybdenum cofactor biosynthesis protein MoaE [Anaerolineae bacterium]